MNTLLTRLVVPPPGLVVLHPAFVDLDLKTGDVRPSVETHDRLGVVVRKVGNFGAVDLRHDLPASLLGGGMIDSLLSPLGDTLGLVVGRDILIDPILERDEAGRVTFKTGMGQVFRPFEEPFETKEFCARHIDPYQRQDV